MTATGSRPHNPHSALRTPHSIWALVGPTAVGKTAVAVELARRLDMEVVSADSRQIYRYMDIGTAKPTQEEQQAVRHHMIDILDPDQRFSAGAYGRMAREVIEKLTASGKTPLVVGGAGLYLRALLGDLFTAPDIPEDIRGHIRRRLDESATKALYERLQTVDPAASERIHPHDRQRILRALEVYEATGTSLTAWQHNPSTDRPLLNLRLIGLQRDRTVLYARINARTDRMIEEGLIQEVQRLLDRGYTADTYALQTFGYAEIINHLRGDLSLDQTLAFIKQKTRRFAKRQMTWFRRMASIIWYTISEDMNEDRICEDIMGMMTGDSEF